MAQRLTKNSFEGGLNTDVDKSKLDPIFATEIHNLETIGDGKFYNLTNIKGTINVQDVINTASTEVLGVFRNRYTISSVLVDCLTIMTASVADGFKIFCYDVENDTLYTLYTESIGGDYLTDDRVIDAIGYSENGIDYLYFTDNYNEPRVIRCEAPATLTSSDLSLMRRGANGSVVLDSITSGGSLLSGTYQFAYRMVDPTTKKLTKWSSLTSPFHVYNTDSDSLSRAGIGLQTNVKIRIDVTPSTEELANFDYFQLAVVENVYPLGAESITDGENVSFVASLLPITSNANRLNFDYKSNTKTNTIPIEDIVVDLAAIKNIKTLTVKQKRLFFGNIDYHNLEFDNGAPSCGGSISVKTTTAADSFSDKEFSSKYKGYFRDETYRFGIVYYDKYGNKSPVKVLDLNAITGNQISGSLPDVHFPSRATSNAYTIQDTSHKFRSLGLSLTNIKNHPTWAVGFEIVRAKRKKKILTQTPIIPMMYVEGIGALDGYPSEAMGTISGSPAPDTDFPNASPQTSTRTYVPKNLFWPEAKSIKRNKTTTGSAASAFKAGESFLSGLTTDQSSMFMIFPPEFMYGDESFVLGGNEKLNIVDYCITKANVVDYNTSVVAGDDLETKVGAVFYAVNKGDYYFDPAWSSKSISSNLASITAYKTFDNLASTDSLSGKSLMNYEGLETEGITQGYKPNIQKCVVIDVPNSNGHSRDVMGNSLTFANATMNSRGAGSVYLFGAGGPQYDPLLSHTNKYINEYSGFSNKSSYVQAFSISNIVNDLGDDRYGDVETQHEFISTGASYTFSTSELVDVAAGTTVNVNLEVFGGDCFVGFHTFKVSDGAYSVVNQTKASTGTTDTISNLINKWKYWFFNSSGASICLPVGVKASSQFIQIALESEYNGGVMDKDILSLDSTINGLPILDISGEDSLGAPLTYNYNINLSKQNDEKVYLPLPDVNFVNNNFPSRISYSDQKIYNTTEQGFDVFRVLNTFDLEERYGDVTKLSLAGDNMYAIQENGIVYLPTGQSQLEQTDAGILAVGTGDVIGRTIIIDDKRGAQHLRGIVEAGGRIYIPDVENKAVYALAGQELQIISDMGVASLFRDKFSSTVAEKNLIGVYDAVRKEYWLADNAAHWCHRFDGKAWRGNYEFSANGSLQGGSVGDQTLFLIGKVGNQISVYSMYTGDANQLFGQTVTPRVSYVTNPEDQFSKVFDNKMFVADGALATIDFVVERPDTNQTVSGTIIDGFNEGNYRIKLPRDASTARLRGLRLISTLKWDSSTTDVVSLSSVFTKYRLSARSPF